MKTLRSVRNPKISEKSYKASLFRKNFSGLNGGGYLMKKKTLIKTIPAGTKFECFDTFVGWTELKNPAGKTMQIPCIMFHDENGNDRGTMHIPYNQAIFAGFNLMKYGIKSTWHNRWFRKELKK